MKSRYVLLVAAAAGLLFSQDYSAFAQVPFPAPPALKPFPFVSPLFGDDMVLQRGKMDAIWGWSEPGDRVRVQIGNKTASGVADADRRWEVRIHRLQRWSLHAKITGRESVEFHNVMVGDVWLCAGQSNMLVPLGGALNGADEVKATNYPDIRFFDVFGHSAYNHTGWVAGSWKVISPETAARVSAVAYYFARQVQKDAHIPIGLIVDAVGGTPAEAWTSATALRPLHDFDLRLT